MLVYYSAYTGREINVKLEKYTVCIINANVTQINHYSLIHQYCMFRCKSLKVSFEKFKFNSGSHMFGFSDFNGSNNVLFAN